MNSEFLIKVLKHVNLGGKIIGLIKMMYNNIESTVIRKRSQTRLPPISIPLQHSNKIRYDINITGLKIDDKIIKQTLLADDLTLILKDLLSVENALKLLRKFSHCFGLKINIDKTKAKSIGRSLTPHGLSWIKTPLETIGIYITNNHDDNLNFNFKPKIATLKNLLSIWK